MTLNTVLSQKSTQTKSISRKGLERVNSDPKGEADQDTCTKFTILRSPLKKKKKKKKHLNNPQPALSEKDKTSAHLYAYHIFNIAMKSRQHNWLIDEDTLRHLTPPALVFANSFTSEFFDKLFII